ncbi:hypothetical protein [Methylobacterium mesophilicum]|uniref:hypothetical protein n=1 Tax=Methylobacterium mesophilicum TaxID=39956 RepID=UPI002F355891
MTRSRPSIAALILSLLAGLSGGFTSLEARERPAQGTVTIPSDAVLNRLEREAITMPPLDVTGTPPGSGDGTRERRERRIKRTSPERGGACDDC